MKSFKKEVISNSVILFSIIMCVMCVVCYMFYIFNEKQGEHLQQTVDSLNIEVKTLRSITNDFETKVVLMTAYNPVESQCDNTPTITASGTKVNHMTLALSRDQIKAENEHMIRLGYNPKGAFVFGDSVWVVYIKLVILEDTMHRNKINRGDLLTFNYNDAKLWGKRKVLLIKRKNEVKS